MTESKAIEVLEYIRKTGNGEAPYVGCAQNIAIEMAINALGNQIARNTAEYEYVELDDEIKLPKISRLEAKAIKVALYHQWLKTTDDNGNAISCSQEMADATYKMLSLFDELTKENNKDDEIKNNKIKDIN